MALDFTQPKKLASAGASVILHGRNLTRLTNSVTAVRDIAKGKSGDVFSVLADLSNLSHVQRMAKEIKEMVPRLDCIINNAGVVINEYQQSFDKHELTFAINVNSHHLLTILLVDILVKSSS